MNLNDSKGFTLIEVLVAIVVFSFGLLGVAGLMSISVKSNHNGYLRSQANFLAENMVDRMRANPVALWEGDYTGTASGGTNQCDIGNPCNYTELAAFDMQQWANSLTLSLPSGLGNIACDAAGATETALVSDSGTWRAVRPYEGICTVTVTWTESNSQSGNEAQQVILVVQP